MAFAKIVKIKNKKMKKINQKTILKEILKIKGSEEILKKHNFPCLFCPMLALEIEKLTIGEICENYHLETKKILEDLNNLLKGRNKKSKIKK